MAFRKRRKEKKETEASIGLLQKLWEGISPSPYQSSEETEMITKGKITKALIPTRTTFPVSNPTQLHRPRPQIKLLNKW